MNLPAKIISRLIANAVSKVPREKRILSIISELRLPIFSLRRAPKMAPVRLPISLILAIQDPSSVVIPKPRIGSSNCGIKNPEAELVKPAQHNIKFAPKAQRTSKKLELIVSTILILFRSTIVFNLRTSTKKS